MRGGMPRCMVQMDIQKPYDSVEWPVIKKIMAEIGFPRKFMEWIMLAVCSVSYNFNVNGSLSKSMRVVKGQRQCDPI